MRTERELTIDEPRRSRELTADELNQVTGGMGPVFLSRMYPAGTISPGLYDIRGESID
jgi:bacteriocin-like protein